MSEFTGLPGSIDKDWFQQNFGGKLNNVPSFVEYVLPTEEAMGFKVVDCGVTRDYLENANQSVRNDPENEKNANGYSSYILNRTIEAFPLLKDNRVQQATQEAARIECWLVMNEATAEDGQVDGAKTLLNDLYAEIAPLKRRLNDILSRENKANHERLGAEAYRTLLYNIELHSEWHTGIDVLGIVPDCLQSDNDAAA